VDEAALTAGDYAIGEDCLVERKAVRDLHRSLCSGRLWRQVGALRRSTKSPCLLVEGATIYGGPVAHAAIRGTLLAIADLGVLVIRSENPEDSARWIHQLLERRASPGFRDRVPYAFRYARDAAIDPAEQALAAAPGISTIVARATLEHFGCLREVLTADLEALAQVPGVGTRRAQAIHDLAGGTRPSHSAKRNGVRRAT
jgi:ERCC4-type nuclease